MSRMDAKTDTEIRVENTSARAMTSIGNGQSFAEMSGKSRQHTAGTRKAPMPSKRRTLHKSKPRCIRSGADMHMNGEEIAVAM
mmetsp:Transcript_72405/g.136756  ORF Transcript_72405/g.136756 Transcript_72405/m.136756 type:complete len:83 (-) Transcript_72405:305-553(-)